ncbi:MAG: GIY-YIG nuclease family protein [Vicinamibacterales bacterium]
MNTTTARREATKDLKARKAPRGVYALRCMATRQVWVDASANLTAARNGLWFFLQNGLHRDAVLQGAWRAHGEQAFRYEVLETLEDTVSDLAAADLLQGKKNEWAAKVKALPIGV